MHQENLVGKPTHEMTATQQLEQKRNDEAGIRLAELQQRLALEKARIATSPPVLLDVEQSKIFVANINRTRQEQSEKIGRAQWTLRSLIETLKGTPPAHVTADMARNFQLAVEHLEDAQHRLERVVYEYDIIT